MTDAEIRARLERLRKERLEVFDDMNRVRRGAQTGVRRDALSRLSRRLASIDAEALLARPDSPVAPRSERLDPMRLCEGCRNVLALFGLAALVLGFFWAIERRRP